MTANSRIEIRGAEESLSRISEVKRREVRDGFERAADVVRLGALEDEFPTYLTIPAYAHTLGDELIAVPA